MNMIALEKVAITFPHVSHPTLDHISYQIKQKDFVILLGGNGSGKSTLLKLLSRQYQPTSGKINFLQKSLASYSEKKVVELIGMLTQNASDSLFPSLSLYESYLLVKRIGTRFIHHKKERAYLLKYLPDFNINLNKKLDLPVERLSGGEKQAFALALRLLHPPAVLLLDEHTSALDPKTSDQIMQLTQKMIVDYQITCVLTTHDLDLALKYGNRILLLHNGTVHKAINEEEKKRLTKEDLISYYF